MTLTKKSCDKEKEPFQTILRTKGEDLCFATSILVATIQTCHLRGIWELIERYPYYFDDTLHLKTYNDFKDWYTVNDIVGVYAQYQISSLFSLNGGLIGCAYLTSLENGNGCINLVMKRKSIPFHLTIELYRKYINYFIDKYDLKMLYAIVRVNNLACLQLLKILGFKITTTLEKHEVVNGKLVDCVLATYIRDLK